MFCPDLSHFFNGLIFKNTALSKKFGGTSIHVANLISNLLLYFLSNNVANCLIQTHVQQPSLHQLSEINSSVNLYTLDQSHLSEDRKRLILQQATKHKIDYHTNHLEHLRASSLLLLTLN